MNRQNVQFHSLPWARLYGTGTRTVQTSLFTMLTGKALILATKPYTGDHAARSWWAILSTLFAYLGSLLGAVALPHWALQTAASLLAGLLFLRMFVIYHDHQHHAILPKSRVARLLMRGWGIFSLTPNSIWNHSHNHHHNHNSKIRSAHIGSYPVMTVERYRKSTRSERFKYLAIRHPLTILSGYISVFLIGMSLLPAIEDPKTHRDSILALVLHAAIYAAVIGFLGWQAAFFALFLPFFLASAIGAYLFYAQHNFPDVTYIDKDGWSYEGAALLSSSFCRMGPLINYFTANIGYHHIHHLNAKIPFYRLPEAYHAIPELQAAKTTSLHPREILRCLRLKVWDVKSQRMIGLGEVSPEMSAGQ